MQARQLTKAFKLLVKMSRPHRAALARGIGATVGVVLLRIATPWPLRGIMEQAFPGMAGHPGQMAIPDVLPVHPVLILCAAYFLLSVCTGLMERSQRVWMARVASATAHDLRAAAVHGARRSGGPPQSEQADFITRIIGDSARLKADLKGILIHLLQNGLLLIGITILFMALAPVLGLLFLASGLLAVLIGYRAVQEIARTTKQQRRKESRYALLLGNDPGAGEAEQQDAVNRSSARKEVRTTWLMGRSTLHVYAGVAALISLALWLGFRDVQQGTMAPGVLFLFIAYSITIQRRAVRVGRQIARAGKLLANTHRLRQLVGAPRAAVEELAPLRTSFALEKITVRASPAQRRRRRLGPVTLQIPAGARLLVLGSEGAGKTTLLQALAGDVDIAAGRMLWDGRDLAHELWTLRQGVTYLPQTPAFRATSIRQFLGLESGVEPSAEQLDRLVATGAWRVIRRMSSGLDQSIDARLLAPSEGRSLGLGAAILSPCRFWILDTPVAGRRRRDKARMEKILQAAGRRTLVVALPQPLLTSQFSHVLVLRRGQVAFHGTCSEWEATRG